MQIWGLILIMHKEEVGWTCSMVVIFSCIRIFLSIACDFTEYGSTVRQLISSRYYLAGFCSQVQHFQGGFSGPGAWQKELISSLFFFLLPNLYFSTGALLLLENISCLNPAHLQHPGPETTLGAWLLLRTWSVPSKKLQKGEFPLLGSRLRNINVDGNLINRSHLRVCRNELHLPSVWVRRDKADKKLNGRFRFALQVVKVLCNSTQPQSFSPPAAEPGSLSLAYMSLCSSLTGLCH